MKPGYRDTRSLSVVRPSRNPIPAAGSPLPDRDRDGWILCRGPVAAAARCLVFIRPNRVSTQSTAKRSNPCRAVTKNTHQRR